MAALHRLTCVAALALGFAVPITTAEAVSPGDVIDCGADKAVLLEQPRSPDGRYAVGWTLRPTSKDAKPVDWSKWDPEAAYDFVDSYDFLNPEMVGGGSAPLVDAAKQSPASASGKKHQAPYELCECIVDLKKKQLLRLCSDWPYWPNKNRGWLGTVWSKGEAGVYHAVVIDDARFYTSDVWMIEAGDAGLRQFSLTEPLDAVVDRILKETRPLIYTEYGIRWTSDEEDKPSFTKTTVRLPFSAEIPKSDYEPVEGVVTVDLATRKITKVECHTKRDDPFQDNPKLARADKELNATYGVLLKKLKGPARAALQKEQRIWLASRDYASPVGAGSPLSASVIAFQSDHLRAVPPLGTEDDYVAFNLERDDSLIESTRERTVQLRKRWEDK